jgi:hypothetical protein
VSSLFWLYPAETSTPLDLVYDMPPGIKPVPANMWVWELRERIEEAHTLVRTYALNIVSSVRLKRSTIPSDFGWYGVVLVLVVPSIWHIS